MNKLMYCPNCDVNLLIKGNSEGCKCPLCEEVELVKFSDKLNLIMILESPKLNNFNLNYN